MYSFYGVYSKSCAFITHLFKVVFKFSFKECSRLCKSDIAELSQPKGFHYSLSLHGLGRVDNLPYRYRP